MMIMRLCNEVHAHRLRRNSQLLLSYFDSGEPLAYSLLLCNSHSYESGELTNIKYPSFTAHNLRLDRTDPDSSCLTVL